MINIPKPGPLFNPLTSSEPLSVPELLAGPFGLIVFLPLIPVVLLLARRYPRAALLVGGLAWLLPTLRPLTTGVLLASLGVAIAWILALGALRRRERIGRGAMIALVWLGIVGLASPLWWYGQQSWYPSRLAALHNVGFAYFLLRLIAWGVDLAKSPQVPARLIDTVCWLLYPPCMRLGPVLLRDEFLERFDAWDVRRSPAWFEGTQRLGLFFLGVVGLAFVGRHVPIPLPGGGDVFSQPEAYPTARLVRAFYLVPIQIYLILWTYNELAMTLSLWVGIRVDNNFDWLPRATSVRDFWRRWHVTVGKWLRNYIYIPLGGNRRNVYLNTFAVFGFCAIWHGASWSFLAWGASQALALGVQRLWDQLRARWGWQGRPSGPLWTAVCWLLTMHYQIATIVVFADFDHLGVRLGRELLGRLVQVGG